MIRAITMLCAGAVAVALVLAYVPIRGDVASAQPLAADLPSKAAFHDKIPQTVRGEQGG